MNPLTKAVWKVVGVIFVLGLLGLLLIYLEGIFDSPQHAAETFKGLGMIGPLAIILMIILEVVIAPVPGWFASIASGFAFGVIWGAVFSYIGNLAGTCIAFMIAKKFGRPIVKRFFKKEKFQKYDCIFHEKGKKFLWIVYFFPLFPIDLISYMVGLSKIKFKDFFFIVSIAFVPYNLLLGYFGSALYGISLRSFFPIPFILVFVLLIGFIIYHHVLNGNNQCKG